MKAFADMAESYLGILERAERCLFLIRRADREVGAFGTRDGTGNEDDTIVFSDSDNLEILGGGLGGAHVAGHRLVFPNATGSGSRTNGSRPAVHHVAVCLWLTVEAVALDRTLEAATNRVADDIHVLTGFEKC